MRVFVVHFVSLGEVIFPEARLKKHAGKIIAKARQRTLRQTAAAIKPQPITGIEHLPNQASKFQHGNSSLVR